MKNLYVTLFSAFLLGSTICTGCAEKKTGSSGEVIEMIHKVNGYWQTNHPEHGRSFWDNAAYGNTAMEKVTTMCFSEIIRFVFKPMLIYIIWSQIRKK